MPSHDEFGNCGSSPHEHEKSATSVEPIERPLADWNDGVAEQPTVNFQPGEAGEPDRLAFGPICNQQFGDYVIQDEIARGGVGVVYKAFHPGLNRVVALKCLQLGALASPRDILRFQGEARAAARLDHPHIVPVFEVGTQAGLHYYAMGFVDGESLSVKLRGGPWHPRAGAVITELLARALAYAHEQGIIHRDLKPGNIMIDRSGQPRITDFGLAKRLQDDSNLTISGEVVGTPNYIPPEQAKGHLGDIAPAADIYSLGAILYSLLTGRPPFQAASINETLMQVLECEPVPPSRLNSVVPKDLETICLKCLQKTPIRRYASASDLADDLQRFLNGKPIVARPIRKLEHAWRWCYRNPVIASLSLMLIVVAVLGASVSLSYAVRASAKAEEAEDNLAQANRVTVRLKSEQDRTGQVLYHSQIQQAYWEWKLGNTRKLSERLAACNKSLRGWEHNFLSALPRRGHQTWNGHSSIVHCAILSPDGRRLVSGSRDRTIRVWDVETGRELHKLEDHRGAVTCLAFSRNGRWLVSGSEDRTIRVWDMNTMSRRRILRNFTAGVTSLEVTPDDAQIIAITGNGSVKVFRFATFEEYQTLLEPSDVANDLAISPDGKLLAIATDSTTVRLWNLETHEETGNLTGHLTGVSCLEFGLNGRWLAGGSMDGVVKIWDVTDRKEARTFHGHAGRVNSVTFSDDGKRVISAGMDAIVNEWELDTSLLRRSLRGHSRSVNTVVALRTTSQIVSGSEDGTLKVWEPDTDQESIVMRGHTGWVDLAVFNSSETTLATGSADHSVRLWNVSTGQLRCTCQGRVQRVEAMAFSGDETVLWCLDGFGEIHLFDANTGAQVESRGSVNPCGAAAFSNSLKQYVTAGSSKVVNLWDVQTDHKIAAMQGHSAEVTSLAISPDEKWIASGSVDKTVRLWDAVHHNEVHVMNGHSKRVRSVGFDSTGTQLVSTSDDHTLRTWDVATGRQLLEMTGHTAYVRSAQFSPDGQRIISGSIDNQAKLWDARTGDEILTLRGHRDAVLFVAFSVTGRHIVSGSSDRTARIWSSAESR